MKVKDLIKELKKYDQDLDVIVWSEELDDNYNVSHLFKHKINYLEEDDVNNEELIINVK